MATIDLPDELAARAAGVIDAMGDDAPLPLKQLWGHLDGAKAAGQAGPAEPPPDPLQMARNCVGMVLAAARGEQRLFRVGVHHVGAQADQDSKVAARMALVSIAEDVHRLAGEFYRFSRDQELKP